MSILLNGTWSMYEVFNPVLWIALVLLTILVEYGIIRSVFKELPNDKEVFLLFAVCAGNVVTAFLGLLIVSV